MVRHLNPRLLGVIVGGFICFTNARVLLGAMGISGSAFFGVYLFIVIAWSAAILVAVSRVRNEADQSARR